MCATSIGSTFSHRPVPGERKSGIPDGTEIPAPVRATTEPAPRISSARRSTSVPTVLTEPRSGPCSLALELRGPLLQERRDPLARVLGTEDRREPGLLGPYARIEIARSGHGLDLLDRQRRLPSQLPRPRERTVEQLVVGDDAGGEAQLVRLVGSDRIADQVHLERLRLTHQPRQALGAAETGDDPEADLRLAERRRLRGDPEVARH